MMISPSSLSVFYLKRTCFRLHPLSFPSVLHTNLDELETQVKNSSTKFTSKVISLNEITTGQKHPSVMSIIGLGSGTALLLL